MRRDLALVAVLGLLALPLTGCLGASDDDADVAPTARVPAAGPTKTVTDTSGEVRDLATGLVATDVLEGPGWEVGQWFGYHVFFGMDDDEGFHYDAVVARDEGSSWFVATTDEDLAKFEAIVDLQVLGSFAKKDLGTTVAGIPFSWYQFPLTDGATWTARTGWLRFDAFDAEPIDLSYTATYNPSIRTPDGAFPGFDIEARTAEGKLAAKYDFVPAIGWVAHLYLYDLASEGEDWILHMTTMGFGTEWTGTYYTASASEAVQHHSDFALNPDAPQADVSPATTFTVSDQAHTLMGLGYAYTFTGASHMELVDPEHERYEWTALATPMAFAIAVEFIEVPAKTGTWAVLAPGAGIAAGSGLFLWEMVVESFVMG